MPKLCNTYTLKFCIKFITRLFWLFGIGTSFTPVGLTQEVWAEVLCAFLLPNDASQGFLWLQGDLVRLGLGMFSLCGDTGFRNLRAQPECSALLKYLWVSGSPPECPSTAGPELTWLQSSPSRTARWAQVSAPVCKHLPHYPGCSLSSIIFSLGRRNAKSFKNRSLILLLLIQNTTPGPLNYLKVFLIIWRPS